MKGKKILIVDDDLHMRIFMSTVLTTNGYRVIVAKDGTEGIKRAREAPPDLIILDIMMPGEGGVLMYRQLKTDACMNAIPVVMVSGVENRAFSHSLKILNLGSKVDLPQPDAYIEKPPKPQELLAVIKKNLKA